jgi:hypothetical protein
MTPRVALATLEAPTAKVWFRHHRSIVVRRRLVHAIRRSMKLATCSSGNVVVVNDDDDYDSNVVVLPIVPMLQDQVTRLPTTTMP